MKARKINNQNSQMAKYFNDTISVRQFTLGDIIEGYVIKVSDNEILLDVGAKSEGVIAREEFGIYKDQLGSLKAGDLLVAQVIQSESDQGYVVLSLKRAEKERKWREVETMYSTGKTGEAKVIEYNKGGLLVDFLGLRGFIPLSHLDRVHFTEDVSKFSHGSETELKESLKVLSGKFLKIKVIEFDKEKNRLVLSEKKALEHYSEDARRGRLSQIKPGDISDGVITGVMPFGVFIDLDGIEGLVHISEIAWEKVENPATFFSVGQTVKVKVMGIDETSGKLALSVKRLSENPKESTEEQKDAE
jgi:small subunit ribosomal protein S1